MFCICALNCAKARYRKKYLPIERGSICLKSEVTRLLSAQLAEMEPISASGACCVLR